MVRRIATMSARSALDVITSIVMITAASILIYRTTSGAAGNGRPGVEVPSTPVAIDGAPIRGSEDAPVVMIVYSDFQCPFCARFARDVLPEVERSYVATGKVAVAFRHLPLPIHEYATQAAMSAECAGEQGRFWEMHDLLFALEKLNGEAMLSLAESLDLDKARFDGCLADQDTSNQVRSSAAAADALGVRSTPTFFFGKRLDDGRVRVLRVLSGARPIDEFTNQLDRALVDASSMWRGWGLFAAIRPD